MLGRDCLARGVRWIGCLLGCCLSIAGSGGTVAQEANGNWPQWRGPTGNGVASPDAAPPIQWSETEHVRWKTAIPGRGLGTPVAWDGKLYLLTAVPQSEMANKDDGAQAAEPKAPVVGSEPRPSERERPAGERGAGGRGGPGRGQRGAAPVEHSFMVCCVDAESGKVEWEKVVCRTLPHEGHHQTNSYASSSAVTDGQHIYAYFGSFGVYCLKMDGTVVWTRDFGSMETRNGFGEGSSPALYGSTLVVPWDHEGQSMIYALDARTGDVKWQQERDEPTTWSTPLITEYKGRVQVITNGSKRIRSYDLENGELIWECGGMGPNPIPTPLRIDDLVICMTGFRVYAIAAIPLSAVGDITETDQVVWRRNDAAPYVPSALLYEGHLYLNKSQEPLLSILDARSGETLAEAQRLPELNNLYASPIAAAGRIYISSRNGTTVVLKHGLKLEILATNKIDEGLDASPVAIGKRLYLRGSQHLYCLE